MDVIETYHAVHLTPDYFLLEQTCSVTASKEALTASGQVSPIACYLLQHLPSLLCLVRLQAEEDAFADTTPGV